MGLSLAVRLSAIWSSLAVLAFAVGSRAEMHMHKQIFCFTGLVACNAVVLLHLQHSSNGHSAVGCTTGLAHQPNVLGH